jgi:hypothetical protein
MVLNSAKIVCHRQKLRSKNTGGKKNYFLKTFFELVRNFFSNFFFLFLVWICLKFTAKKEKSRKKLFNTLKTAA